jgi:hypothetical protein
MAGWFTIHALQPAQLDAIAIGACEGSGRRGTVVDGDQHLVEDGHAALRRRGMKRRVVMGWSMGHATRRH